MDNEEKKEESEFEFTKGEQSIMFIVMINAIMLMMTKYAGTDTEIEVSELVNECLETADYNLKEEMRDTIHAHAYDTLPTVCNMLACLPEVDKITQATMLQIISAVWHHLHGSQCIVAPPYEEKSRIIVPS